MDTGFSVLIVTGPVLDAVEYYDVDYLNAFTQTSIYRGPPSPELDKAWLDLWLCEYP